MTRYKIKPKLYVDTDPTKTIYIQNEEGLMQGRRHIKKYERADKLLNLREKSSGRLYGFLPSGITKIQVHGSSHSRGTTRTLRRQL